MTSVSSTAEFATSNLPLSGLPSVTVQGAFINGGNNSGTVRGPSGRLRVAELFRRLQGRALAEFRNAPARLSRRELHQRRLQRRVHFQQHLETTSWRHRSNTPIRTSTIFVARAILFDAALFYQDDWKLSPRFTFSYGVRWESQNRINDKDDWAPRMTLRLCPRQGGKNKQPKTVLRAGYGWFYQRFTVPNTLASTQGTPYIIQAIHNNFVPLGSTVDAQSAGLYRDQSGLLQSRTRLCPSLLPAAPLLLPDTPSIPISTQRSICRPP